MYKEVVSDKPKRPKWLKTLLISLGVAGVFLLGLYIGKLRRRSDHQMLIIMFKYSIRSFVCRYEVKIHL